MNVAIVGGGLMGEALLGAALEAGVLEASSVTVIEKLEPRRAALESKHGVHVSGGLEAVADADVVLLSVKPQEMKSVATSLKPGALLLSIMAGVTIASLRETFRHEAIVRVMPNTPAAIRSAMSAWFATPAVTPAQREFVQSLLSAIGSELYVDDEKKIDMVTAVSGSGPAYVFMFIEAMIDGAVAIGLPRLAAEELVLQTLVGSSLYARGSNHSAAELRAMVTSPAGTTAAGLLELEKGAFRASVIECVRAAHQRALELGKA
ncbi:MAG: pyrroline-5-carboxylate reductase [Dehalococcoidia bacterium]